MNENLPIALRLADELIHLSGGIDRAHPFVAEAAVKLRQQHGQIIALQQELKTLKEREAATDAGLRDQLAMAALQGTTRHLVGYQPSEFASWSYLVADAMLEARKNDTE